MYIVALSVVMLIVVMLCYCAECKYVE
jgi:hypothetical protein